MASKVDSLATKNTSPNSVIRIARCRCGHLIDYLTAPHDGSPQGIIRAARRITDEMYACYDNVSNTESLIFATDADGKPAWSVSQNFRILTQI